MKAVRRNTFLFRHYRSGDWCPYQGVIRSADDAKEVGIRLLDELTDHLRDGDEFELVVRKTGRKVTNRYELTELILRKTSQPKSRTAQSARRLPIGKLPYALAPGPCKKSTLQESTIAEWRMHQSFLGWKFPRTMQQQPSLYKIDFKDPSMGRSTNSPMEIHPQ